MTAEERQRPGKQPPTPVKVVTCDLCEVQGFKIPDSKKHALSHCARGEHCTSTSAACAAGKSLDDHPGKCCDCEGRFP